MDESSTELHDLIGEALVESAPLAWNTALETCYVDDSGRRPCTAYHRVWQYLSLLGVTSTMRTETGFFLKILRQLAQEKRDARILISGAADYAMLAHILWAFELEGGEPEICVLDLCETPLKLNRWYAERRGAKIETTQGNILDFEGHGAFDAICTHSFIGWFSPDDQRRLVACWHDALRPGGVVITAKRVRASSDAFERPEASAFGEKVREAAGKYAGSLDLPPDELAQAACDYALGRTRYPTPSVEAIFDLFEDAGFQIVEQEQSTTSELRRDKPAGPQRGAGTRVRFVAQKPD